MAKIRTLKRQLKTLTNDLLDELIIYQKFHVNADVVVITKIKNKIFEMSEKYASEIRAIRKLDDTKEVKKEVSRIITDMHENMIPVLDQLSDAK